MNAEGTALVTGANRGIGRAIALELAERGFEVLATMRDPQKGQSLLDEASGKKGQLRVARLDVNDPGTITIPPSLKVLVNNAGVEGEYLSVEDASMESWRHMFETNVFGLLETTRRALPTLRANGGGVVCNLTSASILYPMPFYSAYRASKAAASALGESLRTEVAPHGIRVLEILPGPIDTDMLAGSERLPESSQNEAYRELAEKVLEQRKGVGAMTTPTAEAARLIADAILDDNAPLRVGCDELSRGAIDAWRSNSDEDLMKGFIAAYSG